jgi:ferredoxin
VQRLRDTTAWRRITGKIPAVPVAFLLCQTVLRGWRLKKPDSIKRIRSVAFKITDGCVSCWACEPLCPSQAIYLPLSAAGLAKPHFLIDAEKCTECAGDYADPQCSAICPVEGVILDSFDVAVNPPGSLTGIPPEQLAAAMAEIQAR